MAVSIDSILHFLVARTSAPSSFGAQLDRLRFGVHSQPDPFRARADVEDNMLAQAQLLRCLDEFTARQDFGSLYKSLQKVQLKSSPKLDQGYIALGALRAYHEWCSQSQERGLVEVYRFLEKISPGYVPPPPDDEPDLLQAFRTNKAKRARSRAAEVYADALLALQAHTKSWNRKHASRS